MTTPADDITPEEIEAIQKRCDAADTFDGPDEVSNMPTATVRRLLAALRRREVERDSKDAALTKVCGELLAAKALLARAVDVLRSIRDHWDCDADAHRYGTNCRACWAEKCVAEIEAEHGR